jgi:hypothetical protein
MPPGSGDDTAGELPHESSGATTVSVMRLIAPAIALSLSAVALLAGCASSAPAAEPAEEPTPTQEAPAGPVEYGSIDDLRDAYIAAGGDCDAWEQTNVVTLSAESGDCANGDGVLMTFTSEENRDEAVDGLTEFADMIGSNLLVGPNWVINAADVREVRDGMGGGTLVIKEPTE